MTGLIKEQREFVGLEDVEIRVKGVFLLCPWSWQCSKEREASPEKTSEGPSCLFLAIWLQPIVYKAALGHLDV